VERNRKAGQNPPRVVQPTEKEEEYVKKTHFQRFKKVACL